jgi:hypothetical protein
MPHDDRRTVPKTNVLRFRSVSTRFVLLFLLGSALFIEGCATTTRDKTAALKTAATAEAHAGSPPQSASVLLQMARVKNPIAQPLKFSPQQCRTVHMALLPGDVLLTYTAGVSSNVLVPGRFKHALVYVGPPGERPDVEATPADEPGDVIEALAEGVILTHLDDALATRINRLVVLRPRLSEFDRRAYVAEVLSYRGQKYDYTIDFRDPSRKVCTEVVYCGLHGRGGIELPLVTRAGRPTLISDDIVQTHLNASTPQAGFTCILVADEDPQHPEQAHVLLNSSAQQHLEYLMRPTFPLMARK